MLHLFVKNSAEISCIHVTYVFFIRLCNRFNDLVGKNIGDYALQHGLLFTPNEALKIGLVDKVSDDEDLIKTAKAELDKYLLLPCK